MRADARRAQIVACARDVFASNGFHVTSVADICEAAGIGRGTLYQYFGNKRDVFYAVVEDLTDRVRKVMSERTPLQALDGAADAPVSLIVGYCRRRLRVMLDAVFFDESALRLILREARGLDGGIEELIKTIDGIVLSAIVDDLATARDLGLIDCPDPQLVALFVLGGVEKMVLAALHDEQPIDLDRIVSVAINMEMFGLLPRDTNHTP